MYRYSYYTFDSNKAVELRVFGLRQCVDLCFNCPVVYWKLRLFVLGSVPLTVPLRSEQIWGGGTPGGINWRWGNGVPLRPMALWPLIILCITVITFCWCFMTVVYGLYVVLYRYISTVRNKKITGMITFKDVVGAWWIVAHTKTLCADGPTIQPLSLYVRHQMLHLTYKWPVAMNRRLDVL